MQYEIARIILSFIKFRFHFFQNLKNQIMTTNLWVEQVSLKLKVKFKKFTQYSLIKIESYCVWFVFQLYLF